MEDFDNFYSFVENVHQVGDLKAWCEIDIKMEMSCNDNDENDPPKPDLLGPIISMSEPEMTFCSPLQDAERSPTPLPSTAKKPSRAKRKPNVTRSSPIQKSQNNTSDSSSKAGKPSKRKQKSRKVTQKTKENQSEASFKTKAPLTRKGNSKKTIQTPTVILPELLQPLDFLQTINADGVKKQEDNSYESDFDGNDFAAGPVSSDDYDDDGVGDQNWFDEQINAKQPKM